MTLVVSHVMKGLTFSPFGFLDLNASLILNFHVSALYLFVKGRLRLFSVLPTLHSLNMSVILSNAMVFSTC